jgi:hypothetical protein
MFIFSIYFCSGCLSKFVKTWYALKTLESGITELTPLCDSDRMLVPYAHIDSGGCLHCVYIIATRQRQLSGIQALILNVWDFFFAQGVFNNFVRIPYLIALKSLVGTAQLMNGLATE